MKSAAAPQLSAVRGVTFSFSGHKGNGLLPFSLTNRRFRPMPSSVRCTKGITSNKTVVLDVEPAVIRRSADYKDCVWDHDFIQHSMHTMYNDLDFRKEADEMRKEIGEMLVGVSLHSVTEQLELIDDIQRLGLGYHFQNQIKSILDGIYYQTIKSGEFLADMDLHTAALAFRLLRKLGHFVPEGIFKCFLDRDGEFDTSMCRSVKGMISLYEASFLAIEGETIMDKARTFAITNLKEADDDTLTLTYLGVLKARALEMPLHWRTERAEARWHIEESYVKNPKMSSCLLRFAKLDYNIVQAMYQEELLDLSRWWKSLGFKEGLGFARDCLVASYLWSIYICPEPKDIECRKVVTKTIALVCTVDDICDIYATLDEVVLLTDTFARWDIDSMNKLPPYLKKCYLACYNTVNQMSYEVLNRNGFDATLIFKSAWAKLLRAFMKEARWYNNGHKPTLNEYLDVAWISIGASLVALHAQAFDQNTVGSANVGIELKYLETDPDISKWSAMIVRLTDDLGTSSAEMERGDNPKSIECVMRETGETEEGAREKVKEMVMEIWKKMNKCEMEEMRLGSAGVRRLMNLARGGHCCYQHGDGHGIQDKETKHLMSQIIFDPIP